MNVKVHIDNSNKRPSSRRRKTSSNKGDSNQNGGYVPNYHPVYILSGTDPTPPPQPPHQPYILATQPTAITTTINEQVKKDSKNTMTEPIQTDSISIMTEPISKLHLSFQNKIASIIIHPQQTSLTKPPITSHGKSLFDSDIDNEDTMISENQFISSPPPPNITIRTSRNQSRPPFIPSSPGIPPIGGRETEGYLLNPLTNRWILANGAKAKKLRKEGVIT